MVAGAVRRARADLFSALEDAGADAQKRVAKVIHERLHCSEEEVVEYWTSLRVLRSDGALESATLFEPFVHPANRKRTIAIANSDVWLQLTSESLESGGDGLPGWGIWGPGPHSQ